MQKSAPIQVLIALVFLAGLPPAVAAPKSEDAALEEPVEQTVALPPLIIPVLNEDRLWGHAFVQMQLTAKGDIWKVRRKVHHIQDRFVRTAYRAPLVINGPTDKIGAPRPKDLKDYASLLRQELKGVIGDQTDRILIKNVSLRPL